MSSVGKRPPKRNPEHKTPPHNIEAEASVLGAILLRNEAVHQAAEHLTPEDFYIPTHGVIFQAMLALERKGEPIDPVTLEGQLKTDGNMERAGGLAYLTDLSSRVPTAENVGHYIATVDKKSQTRRYQQLFAEFQAEAEADPDDPEIVWARWEQAVFELGKDKRRRTFSHVKPGIDRFWTQVKERSENPQGPAGVPTGFVDLEAKLGGFKGGDFIVLAARPGVGKTSLALNMATNAALAGHPVLFFSLEMNTDQLTRRLLHSMARVDLGKWNRAEDYKKEEHDSLADAANKIYNRPLFFDDSPTLNVKRIAAAARRFRASRSIFEGTKSTGLVVVDYLQRIQPETKTQGRYEAVTYISNALKEVARELDVPVLTLSQLSRKAIDETTEPDLAHLRESGAIEQDADVVAFLWKDADNETLRHWKIAKHRNGPVGRGKLAWFGKFTRFENWTGKGPDGETPNLDPGRYGLP